MIQNNETKKRTFKPVWRQSILTFLAFLFFIASVTETHARGNYHVEVIVFKQQGSTPGNRPPTFADELNSAKTWQSKNVYLNTYASKMRNSGKYQILTHTAWGQKSAPYSKSASKKFFSNGISGFIKVFATQLLIADIKLNFEGHSLSERRRLKLNEVHYFDNNGFGVLMRVSRL